MWKYSKTDNIRELDKMLNLIWIENHFSFPETVLSDGKDYEDLVSIANNYFDVVEKRLNIFTFHSFILKNDLIDWIMI